MIKPCGLVQDYVVLRVAILCVVPLRIRRSPRRSLLPAASLFPPLLPSPASVVAIAGGERQPQKLRLVRELRHRCCDFNATRLQPSTPPDVNARSAFNATARCFAFSFCSFVRILGCGPPADTRKVCAVAYMPEP